MVVPKNKVFTMDKKFPLPNNNNHVCSTTAHFYKRWFGDSSFLFTCASVNVYIPQGHFMS